MQQALPCSDISHATLNNPKECWYKFLIFSDVNDFCAAMLPTFSSIATPLHRQQFLFHGPCLLALATDYTFQLFLSWHSDSYSDPHRHNSCNSSVFLSSFFLFYCFRSWYVDLWAVGKFIPFTLKQINLKSLLVYIIRVSREYSKRGLRKT